MGYLVRMTDENGDEFYKNHAYTNTWGSLDMAQVYENEEHAWLVAWDMPSYNADCEMDVVEV